MAEGAEMGGNPYEPPPTTGDGSRRFLPADVPQRASEWWESRRLRYNLGLVGAGILAFMCYVVVCFTLLPRVLDDSKIEIGPLETLVQGVGYLLVMGIANLCYFLGPFFEDFIRPSSVDRYRKVAYGCGFWFSVLLPFSVPVLLTIKILFFPESFAL